MAKINWTKEKTADLIDMYRNYPCLYATTSKDYSNRNLKIKALDELSIAFSTNNNNAIDANNFRVQSHQSVNHLRDGMFIADGEKTLMVARNPAINIAPSYYLGWATKM